MRAVPAAVACLLLLSAARPVRADSMPDAADALLNQTIVDIHIDGPAWAQALKGTLPARIGDHVTREAVRDSLRKFVTSAPGRLTSAQVHGEVVDGRRGVRLVFHIASVQHIDQIELHDDSPPADATRLVRTLLPRGSEFWPDVVQDASSRIAVVYARAGWRSATVKWAVTPGRDGLRLDLNVVRGAPTRLVAIEFVGDKGLTNVELQSAFSLSPGSQLSMDTLDEGIKELRERYRAGHFYRAEIGAPLVKAADGLAVVDIPLKAGPRFTLQTRGNRAIDSNTLLDQVKYAGDEVLDRATERDLAEKIRGYYELAGYPDAKVDVRESLPQQPPSVAPEKATLRNDSPVGELAPGNLREGVQFPNQAPQVFVTFLVTEGDPQRVVDVRFTGNILKEYPVSDLRHRLDIALKDVIPDTLVNPRDQILLHAAHLSGSPDEDIHANPRVDPREVLSRVGYDNARNEIANLYKSKGYLDVKVGAPEPVQLGGNRLRVTVPIDSGPQSLVASVRMVGVRQMDPALVRQKITVRPGQPLSYFEIDQTRSAIIALYQSEGFLSVNVDDIEPQPPDPSKYEVIFRVEEGVQVHVSSIEIRGASPEIDKLVRHALTLRVGSKITPAAEEDSVRNLIRLGLFTSASVLPGSSSQPQTPLEVIVQERPSVSLDVSGGISVVDGPRVLFNLSAPHFLGSVDIFNVNAKVNLPIFRFCWYGITGCKSTVTQPQTRFEYNVSTGMGFPVFGTPGEVPPLQTVSLVAQNQLKPYYFLQKFSLLGTLSGLPRARLGHADFNTVFQLEVEDDLFQQVNNAMANEVETFSDQRQQSLFPQGQTTLGSFRPTFTVDARDDKLNPMSGALVELAFDLSQNFGGGQGIFTAPGGTPNIPVSLFRTQLTVSGYIPIYKPRRVVFFLWARGGYVDSKLFSQKGELIGSKAFFLGGTETLRGFSEDQVIPQDLRAQYHRDLAACAQTATQVGCTSDALSIRSGALASNPGGSVVVAGRGELRFGITQSIDGAVFFDTGNLWSDPTKVNLAQLRYSTGFGFRTPLPIGPAAIDFGFNLAPDTALGESVFQLHFSIGGG